MRTLRTVRGGVMELGVRRDVAPSTHRQKYLLREPELADLLDRATALRGRWKALLVRDPRQYFTLTRGSTADKAILYVRDNGAKDGFIPTSGCGSPCRAGISCSAVSWPWKPRTWGNWRCISVPNSA
ncbi:MAG: hypothetical protein ACLSHC_00700 [Bilophila wadsworthia]